MSEHTLLVCRICYDVVAEAETRDHLTAHNPNAADLDADEVRDFFSLHWN